MIDRNITWNGEFTTYPLADIAGSTVELYSIERQDRIRNDRRAARGQIMQLLQRNPEEALGFLDATEEGYLLQSPVRDAQMSTQERVTAMLGNIDLLRSIEEYYPLSVRVHRGIPSTTINATASTAFGYVVSGTVFAHQNDRPLGDFTAGKYFALNGFIDIGGKTDDALVVVINRAGYRRGDDIGNAPDNPQMEYLNGCQDTSLTAPDRNGAPCTNLLFVNPGTKQDAHIHPSDRIGVVIDGTAICSTFEFGGASESSQQLWKEQTMKKGDLFLLPAGKLHRFTTGADPLTVFTFHPDSATDSAADNPMMLGTIRSADDAKQWRDRVSGS